MDRIWTDGFGALANAAFVFAILGNCCDSRGQVRLETVVQRTLASDQVSPGEFKIIHDWQCELWAARM
jgi:hypothetical protein